MSQGPSSTMEKRDEKEKNEQNENEPNESAGAVGGVVSVFAIIENSIRALRAAFAGKSTDCPRPQQTAGKSADSPRPQQTADIFKLNIDCFEEFCDYLTFRDLLVMAKTSKGLQRIASYCFQQNYLNIQKTYHDNRIQVYDFFSSPEDNFVEINQLSLYIHKIKLLGDYSLDSFPSIRSQCPRVRKMEIAVAEITKDKMKRMTKALEQIDSLRINHCQIKGKFHKVVFAFCPNLKRLCLNGKSRTTTLIGTNNKWMHRQIPKLERFDLRNEIEHRFTETTPRIDELKTFLEINPNVRTFSVTADCLWTNQESFLNSTISLDELLVCVNKKLKLTAFYGLLNDLHDRGFHKRLQLSFLFKENQEDIGKLDTLKKLEKLDVSTSNYRISLAAFSHLKELHINKSQEIVDLESPPYIDLQIQRIWIGFAAFRHILLLVRKIVGLKKLRIAYFEDGAQFNLPGNLLDVDALNKEREKLRLDRVIENDVSQVTIYVREPVFIATKWTINGRKFDLVRLQRYESYENDSFWL